MHVDMDAFFAAIEQRDDPELRGLPVIIGAAPGQRGVVSTCSYEARKFGIRSAMPISEAYRRCPQGIFLKPDMFRYKAASDSIFEVLRSISPVVEPVSVDEAFVDITGLERLYGPPEAIATITRKQISDELSLTASVGIGPNRVIAKIASEQRKPDGQTVVGKDDVQTFLAPLPVDALRGVGRKTLPLLQRVGIRTVGDLQRMEVEYLQQHIGTRAGMALHLQSHGKTSDFVGHAEERKSISKEVTFQRDEADSDTLRNVMLTLSSEVGSLARRTGLFGQVVTIKVRLPGFKTHTRQRRLDSPSQADLTIYRVGWELWNTSPWTDHPLRLFGIGISDLVSEASHTPDLFAKNKPEADDRFYRVLDSIRDRHGKSVIGFGGVRTKKK